MTEKLSDFTASTPTSSDYIAGATLGSPNKKFLVSDIGVAPAGGNLTFYVATTGSDSNPGTLAQPFATLQHAVNVASQFNYQNSFVWSVNVADGTYSNLLTASDICRLPQFYTGMAPGSGATINGNNATPTNVVIDATAAGSNTNCFVNGSNIFLHLKGFQCNPGGVGAAFLQASFPGGILIDGNMAFGGSATAEYFQCLGGVLDSNGSFTFTFLNTDCDAVFFAIGVPLIAEITLVSTTIVFPNPFVCHFIYLIGQEMSFITMHNVSYVNGSTVVSGDGIEIVNYSILFTNTGDVNDIPPFTYNAGNIFVDNTSEIVGINVFVFGLGVIQSAAEGVSAFSLPSKHSWLIAKDSPSNNRWLATNDGGTVYGIQIGKNPNVQTTSYTAVITDMDGVVEMNVAGANTLTVPLNASVAFPVGTLIGVLQAGAGATTIAGTSGVTVHNAGALSGQWGAAKLYKRGTDEWVQLNGAF